MQTGQLTGPGPGRRASEVALMPVPARVDADMAGGVALAAGAPGTPRQFAGAPVLSFSKPLPELGWAISLAPPGMLDSTAWT